ncbi:Thioesterase/thiol ester dehydrase-isomerase [Melanomma pulvis-pyrius CBS 109.77]|uniref:Thioesterase/thiol ester dehydrase-isomerase n=1 Tax=Melanomma pulvis-pyrius CBS 109.77 TaxID=1314802 RepID=A0A6A6XLY4_9PLEO|nr:Thioesterase/thiol ester dehydrase-isomerase [Melanomma pulvis-pyrius CBS 109.77]
MPADVTPPPDMRSSSLQHTPSVIDDQLPPFESIRYPLSGSGSPPQKRERQWMRARGCISDHPLTHQSALAYMSDTYFVGAISRVHGTRNSPSNQLRTIESKLRAFSGSESEMEQMKKYLEDIRFGKLAETVHECSEDFAKHEEKSVDFVVSLSHSMFFHCPQAFRADEWMFTETEVPWTGGGRGLVTQRIWSKSGELIATCVQEGLVRLRDRKDEKL